MKEVILLPEMPDNDRNLDWLILTHGEFLKRFGIGRDKIIAEYNSFKSDNANYRLQTILLQLSILHISLNENDLALNNTQGFLHEVILTFLSANLHHKEKLVVYCCPDYKYGKDYGGELHGIKILQF